MFNHSNLFVPVGFDRVLRLLVVTPDMHRVHHSVLDFETSSNFGFNLPWWDRLMGTYRAQPKLGHEGMTIGLNQFRDPSGSPCRRFWLFRSPANPEIILPLAAALPVGILECSGWCAHYGSLTL